MPPARGASHPALARVDERELDARREDLLEYVRGSFEGALSEADLEDAVQTAWAEMLEREDGEPIRDLRAFMGTVAWRSANGFLRRPRPTPLDPHAGEFVDEEDPRALLLEYVDARARVARMTEALAQLGEAQREAFSLWFVEEVSPEEACERLGIRRSAYFKRLKLAKHEVEQAMNYQSPGFSRRQRELLSDYVAGIADDRASARAERLIAADPQAAALARELRRTHEAAALALPVLGFGAVADEDLAQHLNALTDRIRDGISTAVSRSPEAVELAGSSTLASGGIRGAGVASAGLIAKTLGGLGTGKLALGCLGGGALATVACVATGVLSLPGQGDERAQAREPRAERGAEPQRSPRETKIADIVSAKPVAPSKSPAPTEAPTRREDSESASDPKPEPEPTLEPTVAPEVQEFGIEGAGTPVGGAPPDTDDSDGASASTVRGEFGP